MRHVSNVSLLVLITFASCTFPTKSAIGKIDSVASFFSSCLALVRGKGFSTPPPPSRRAISFPDFLLHAPTPGRGFSPDYQEYAFSHVRFRLKQEDPKALFDFSTKLGSYRQNEFTPRQVVVAIYALQALNAHQSEEVVKLSKASREEKYFRYGVKSRSINVAVIGREILENYVSEWEGYQIEELLQIILEEHLSEASNEELGALLTVLSQKPPLRLALVKLAHQLGFDSVFGEVFSWFEQAGGVQPELATIENLVDRYLEYKTRNAGEDGGAYLAAMAAVQRTYRYLLLRGVADSTTGRKYKEREQQLEDHYRQFF